MKNKTTILLAGATGRVGRQVARTILDHNIALKVLVRPESVNKPILTQLSQQGAMIVEGDVMKPDSLKPAVEGIDVVMSALRGSRAVIVDGQTNLAEVAKEAGARRIFPSTFSSELFDFDQTDANIADNFILRIRREAAEAITSTGLPATHVMNGTFMGSMIDFSPLTPFNFDEGTFEYWGDGNQPACYTTLTDAVSFSVEAALDPNPPDYLRVAGDVLTVKQMKQVYEGVTKQELEEHRLGSVKDLEDTISQLKEKAETPMDYVLHQIRYGIACGAGMLKPLDNNRYPSVKPVGFKDVVESL